MLCILVTSPLPAAVGLELPVPVQSGQSPEPGSGDSSPTLTPPTEENIGCDLSVWKMEFSLGSFPPVVLDSILHGQFNE